MAFEWPIKNTAPLVHTNSGVAATHEKPLPFAIPPQNNKQVIRVDFDLIIPPQQIKVVNSWPKPIKNSMQKSAIGCTHKYPSALIPCPWAKFTVEMVFDH